MPWPAFRPNQPPMEQLVALSRFYGADPAIVLAGGGNTSVKDGARLHVKASGVALAGVDASGFVEMDRAGLFALLNRQPPEDVIAREDLFKDGVMAARIHPERGQRPSVECTLHNLIPARFVVHTHPTAVNAIASAVDGERVAREIWGDDLLWVPYVDPGYILARRLKDDLAAYEARTGQPYPAVILMQNHGLIVGGGTPDDVRRAMENAVARAERRVGTTDASVPPRAFPRDEIRRLINVIAPALRGLLAEANALKIVTFDDSLLTRRFVATDAGRDMAAGGPLTPDQIVYCKSFPLWFEPEEGEETPALVERLRHAVQSHTETTGFPPRVVLARGLGLFAAGDDFAAADTVRLVYRDAIQVMEGAQRLGGIRAMTRRDREFIDNWEVENYRRQVAAGQKKPGRAAGKVAMVTGAAQGFGLGIAQDLAAEGAHVALADVNEDGVSREAATLAARHGSGRAVGVGINVSDETSVSEAMYAVVRRYGGLDVLVSNAGVLRAGSVKTQPVSEFAFVTGVNYKGYFLCVQNAAPLMAVQHMACPRAWGDIIQINSKSGLEGSNRNAAYAGSKFGGIGLTQSFALELVEVGIKVNAICPGNFFDGPLWSDPGTGLFAQYLRAGKVPGAHSIEDVRRFYEAKVPMGRGCTVADVMKAVYYVMDQAYETGQAVPVTGGQVMLR